MEHARAIWSLSKGRPASAKDATQVAMDDYLAAFQASGEEAARKFHAVEALVRWDALRCRAFPAWALCWTISPTSQTPLGYLSKARVRLHLWSGAYQHSAH